MHDEWADFIFGCRVRAEPTLGLKGGESAAVSPSRVHGKTDELAGDSWSLGSLRSFTVLYCSFVDGFDRGLRFPLIYVLKTKYHMSQVLAFTVFGMSQAPWLAKPLIALVTDSVPILGLRRKPYLASSACVNGVTLALIGTASNSQWGGFMVPATLLTVRTFCRATTRSVIQGMLVEDCHLSSETVERVSQYNTAHRLGQFASVLGAAFMLSWASFTTIFFSVAAFNMGQVFFSFFLHEEQHDIGEEIDLREKVQELGAVVASDQPALRSLLSYTFWSACAPTFEARMMYYLMDVHGLNAYEMSVITVWQTSAGVVAPFLFWLMCEEDDKQLNFLKIFTYSAVPVDLMPLVLLNSELADHGLTVPHASGAAFAMTLFSHLQRLPVNVLQVKLAKRGIEGACYSLFITAEGVGHVGSNIYSGVVPFLLGAVATSNYATMPIYLVFSSLFQLAPLPSIVSLEEHLDEIETVPRTLISSVQQP